MYTDLAAALDPVFAGTDMVRVPGLTYPSWWARGRRLYPSHCERHVYPYLGVRAAGTFVEHLGRRRFRSCQRLCHCGPAPLFALSDKVRNVSNDIDERSGASSGDDSERAAETNRCKPHSASDQ